MTGEGCRRPDPVPFDADADPGRFRAARLAAERYGAGGVHERVAARLAAEAAWPVLDVGCGDGHLAALVPRGTWVGLDRSATLLAAAPHPTVRGDASALPVAASAVSAVAALWVLYHLADPGVAVAEAYRVLRPGGLFAASTTARDDSPELLDLLGAELPDPTPFDAEEAAAIVAGVFGDVTADAWDAPLVHLPDRRSVAGYLRARGVPGEAADEAAGRADVPLAVTKRGVLVWARRGREPARDGR